MGTQLSTEKGGEESQVKSSQVLFHPWGYRNIDTYNQILTKISKKIKEKKEKQTNKQKIKQINKHKEAKPKNQTGILQDPEDRIFALLECTCYPLARWSRGMILA